MNDSIVLSIDLDDNEKIKYEGDIHSYDEPEDIESVADATNPFRNNVVY